jgi:hypothetical protein
MLRSTRRFRSSNRIMMHKPRVMTTLDMDRLVRASTPYHHDSNLSLVKIG